MVKILLVGLIAVVVLIGCAGAPQPSAPQPLAPQPEPTTVAPANDAAEPAGDYPTERPLAAPEPTAVPPVAVELPEPRLAQSQPGRAAPSAPAQDFQPVPRPDERAAAPPAQRLNQELPLPRPADSVPLSGAERHPAAAASAATPPQPQPARSQTPPQPQPQPEPQPEIAVAAQPVTVERRVSAEPSREFSVRLHGPGWVFLGADRDDSAQGAPVEYRRRRSVDGDTEVILRASDSGSYRLRFQRQDLSHGTVERKLIGLDVSADQQRPGDDSSAVMTPEVAPVADTAPLPDDPQQSAAAARTAFESGDLEQAAALWRRNRSLEQPLGSEARRGLFDLAFQSSRYSEALDYAQQMLDHGEAPPVSEITRLAEYSLANDQTDSALDLLQRRLALNESAAASRSAAAADSDALLYQLARLYETDSERRNLRVSLSYYRRITDEFPLSRYWERSRARIEYIERHFIHVR